MAENESIPSKSDDPVPSYFEFEVIKDGNIALELKSQTDAIVLDGVTGDVLETASKQVISGTLLKKNDIVGVTLWSSRTVEGEVKSYVEVTINERVCMSRAVRINGADIIPSIYIDSVAKVRQNINGRNILFDKGRYVFH